MRILAIGIVLFLATGSALAQIIVDGTRDVGYGAPKAVQTVQTQFGDSTGGITSGPARPTGNISTATVAGDAFGDAAANRVKQAAIRTRPAATTWRVPRRSAIHALNGISTAPLTIIGRNTRPA